MKRGDVVIVDYPYSDRMGSKVRPALVVASDPINQTADTIIVAISKSTHRASATQFFIDISTPDGRQTGLRQPSMVQCENILTIDQKFILGNIGRLSDQMMVQAEACLCAALGLP
jgi:mRNA interferase MazF